MSNQLESHCFICFPNNTKCQKTSLIILKLVKIIQIQKKKQKKLISLPSQQYFKQLIDYLRLELPQKSKILQECSHKILKNYLIKKLAISFDQLYCLSQHIYNSLSKRKFQLELIEKIAKNIHEKAFQINKSGKNVETVFKKPKSLETKSSIELQNVSNQSIQNQKQGENKTLIETQEIQKKVDQSDLHNNIKVQELYNISMLNYGIGQNIFYPSFYGTNYSGQVIGYPFDNIRMLVQNGFLM